ncbi:chemotaxis protein MotB [Desulfonatronum thiosulfatophilum]|uniref:Chemotaxis protein MotB n=1 Tax=Desulfonatronum thiosulfatophilum TaxID=617002 RepID=A0A1G6E9H6_9BACT|nr:OmpA family protein [Desulfonatronum thiosulfatophilum]SDB54061.1 chemotaxis protein MotB [Desulfonatronum thiosulfatophilum]
MARRKKKGGGAKVDPMGWLITFSDLITLLLTFFVLLLSMSSMDRRIVTEAMSLFGANLGVVSQKTAGRIPTKLEIVVELMQRPWEFRDNEQRIRDLLFPDDVLPREISKATLEENLRLLQRPEGLAILLTDELLFPLGGHELTQSAQALLEILAPLLLYVPNVVNVSGHTDNLVGRTMDNDTLSALRAMAVLEVLLSSGVPNAKLSVSAYGDRMPVSDNRTPEGRALNRRVGILFKTS